MKYTKLFSILAIVALFAACEKELTEREKLDDRVKDGQKLEVKYLRGGNLVEALAFTHSAVKATVEVQINNSSLKWNLVSNKNWCSVEEEEHCGSGSVVINITANDGFEAREPATLTFVAGEFRGASIQVTQSASAFVISQPYFVATKAGGNWTVNVTTVTGTDWEIENGGWLTATKGTEAAAGTMSTTPVTLVAAANEDESRLGSITLSAGAESDNVYVYQFGTDLTYDTAGDIFFGTDAASFNLVAPGSVVRDVTVPDFATKSVVAQPDGTDLIVITLEQNISDTNEPREVPVTLSLNNSSATLVTLPVMTQDFTPSHGLNSAKGLKAFAAKVAEGASTAPWEREGVVTVLEDINMAGVTDWAGIGTAEHPFTGSFDGGGYSIKNLRASKALFNVCKDASVSNLAMDALCNFSFTAGSSAAAFASSATGSTFSNCTFSGALGVTAASADAKIGGIVGEADTATVVTKCFVNGGITVEASSLASAFIGGVVGYSEGTVSECENTGAIEITASPAKVRAGGITSVLAEKTKVSANTFRGELNIGGTTGTDIRLGGLYGSQEGSDRVFDYTSDKSVIAGSIAINGFGSNTATVLYAGGLLGFIDDGLSLTVKGYTGATTIAVDHASAARKGNWVSYGGILGGCHYEDAAANILFEDVTTNGTISNKYATATAVQITRMSVGGIAGLVNGPATFKNCHNVGEIGAQTGQDNCSRSNGYSQVVGGIAGLCFGGDMLFENCENKGNVNNLHYNNNPILFVRRSSDNTNNFFIPGTDNNAMYSAMSTGGIIGAYNYWALLENHHLVVTGCTAECKVNSMRGPLGGIAGFAGNAEFNNCTWKGSSVHMKQGNNGVPTDNLASDKGGIVGTAARASFSGCIAKGNLETNRYGSAETANAGGIVAYVAGWEAQDSVTVENCSYYGEITIALHTAVQPGVVGGLLGRNDVLGTAVRNSKYGGKVVEQEITSTNLAEFALGYKNTAPSAAIQNKMKAVTVSGTSLWNGN